MFAMKTKISRRIIWGLLALLLGLPLTTKAQTTVNAATCNSADVQTAISSATEGSTVAIPAGTCTWTSGVSISGKGVVVQGAGAGRVIAYSLTTETIGTGTKSLTISPTNAANSMPSLSTGQTLILIENGFLANFMQGTVSSFNSSTGALNMNITSSGGACGTAGPPNTMNSNCKRWLVVTPASTTLVDNVASGGHLFSITEDTSFHTTVAGIHFGQGQGAADDITISRATNGVAVLIHDNFFEQPGAAEGIRLTTNRGVIWNNSFVASPFNGGTGGVSIKDASNSTMPFSWSTASTMGTADAATSNGLAGQNNLYVETNDFHAYIGAADWDDNSRAVFRYNFLNNAGTVSHGADTSFIGMRHFEFYKNVGIFQAYTDGTTANLPEWIYVRGGTFAFHDNTLPALSSQDWGNKPDINMTVMSLQRKDTQPCWGSGFSTAGQYYHAIRQPGFGNVTGTGTVTFPALGYNNASTTTNAGYVGAVYVGDSEPIYIWNNNRTMNVGLSDYGLGNGATSCPASPTPDTSANYLIQGRDYFNGTIKPNYTPYTYPHPLTLGGTGTKPAPPTGLAAIVN